MPLPKVFSVTLSRAVNLLSQIKLRPVQNFLTEKKKVQKKGQENVMIGDVISNDCDISETFINSANIAPNNIYIFTYR